MPFYLFFMINTTMNSLLYGREKTGYLALQSLITNVTVYGTAYALFVVGWLDPSLEGIAILFSIGILMDTLVTWWLHNRYFRESHYAI
ncbi:hypothetical protein C1H69_14745 [Billgrantia endophytica]|uniref:Polysaccharide biosynthesis protein C-terminal domain-containing protein n=1 Tax=Billgrantia endophytica TaxID=2033802 RepID=A0A2N7U236_9GAMM|nr:hypothetical protein C1H69_14745 [Halomonas endophytica]